MGDVAPGRVRSGSWAIGLGGGLEGKGDGAERRRFM